MYRVASYCVWLACACSNLKNTARKTTASLPALSYAAMRTIFNPAYTALPRFRQNRRNRQAA